MSRTGVGRTTNILNVDMQIEFGQLITQMNNVYKGLNKEQKMKILNNAAIPFINSAQAKTPVSSKIHFRYNTAKLIKGIRAPKGFGRKIAQYISGNLKLSIKALRKGVFAKFDNVLYVGPLLARGKEGGKGTFGRARFDGYYAHFLEFGTSFMSKRPFMRPAFEATKMQIIGRIKLGLQKHIAKYTK